MGLAVGNMLNVTLYCTKGLGWTNFNFFVWSAANHSKFSLVDIYLKSTPFFNNAANLRENRQGGFQFIFSKKLHTREQISR